jgi:gamma-glutamylputrescine oxidase
MNLSFWERSSLTHYQHIVIGCGFVGMHIALQLRERFPHDNILIVEKGLLPEGASTKNAGFACTGSPTELLADIKQNGLDTMLQLFEMRLLGLNVTRKLLGDATIGYTADGSNELLTHKETYCLDELSALNKHLHSIVGGNTFMQEDTIIATSGFNASTYLHAVKHLTEGSIDTGKLVKALLSLCSNKNIEIKFGCEVTQIEYEGKQKVLLANSINSTLELHTESVYIATNAFAKNLLPDLDLKPGRGQVLITKPISNLKLKGIFHIDEGYYYFREVQGRILFGGGRNLDFATEETTEFGSTDIVQQSLIQKLKQDILPHTNFEVDYTWSGIMAFGNSKQPIIKKLDDGLFCAVRCGGMGVAIAPVVAKACVALV